MGAFGWIMLIGSFGTATFYWLSQSNASSERARILD